LKRKKMDLRMQRNRANNRVLKGKRGQVLVFAAALMIGIFMLALLVVNFGGLIAMKIHMQNAADSAAMEGGIWYARSLNILSLSNKILAAAMIVKVGLGAGDYLACSGGCTAATVGVGAPACLAACAAHAYNTMKNEPFSRMVMEGQNVFAGIEGRNILGIGAMPAMTELAVVNNGAHNGIGPMPVLPVFNARKNKSILEQFAAPSFNVKRAYLSDYIDKFIEDKIPAIPDKVKGAIRDLVKKVDVPAFIEENGKHNVLVLCIKTGVEPVAGEGFFKDQKNEIIKTNFYGLACAEISGGSMNFWDVNGATYGARLAHVEIPPILGDTGEFEGLKKAGADRLASLQDYVNENVILH
jgi:hypothetical protein